jgi:hypothetical protein
VPESVTVEDAIQAFSAGLVITGADGAGAPTLKEFDAGVGSTLEDGDTARTKNV